MAVTWPAFDRRGVKSALPACAVCMRGLEDLLFPAFVSFWVTVLLPTTELADNDSIETFTTC